VGFCRCKFQLNPSTMELIPSVLFVLVGDFSSQRCRYAEKRNKSQADKTRALSARSAHCQLQLNPNKWYSGMLTKFILTATEVFDTIDLGLGATPYILALQIPLWSSVFSGSKGTGSIGLHTSDRYLEPRL
jgi:hypothetical protein